MRRKLTSLTLLNAAIVISALHYGRAVSASPASLFTGTTLAVGRFDDFAAFNHLLPPETGDEEREGKGWLSWQKTMGSSDLYVQSNTWQPGGSTGWHSHPGHSLIIVTEGTVTGYEGNDPECKPHAYTKGQGFIDRGGDHAHILRNEGAVVAKTIAVQLIPAAADRRIEVADPKNCHF